MVRSWSGIWGGAWCFGVVDGLSLLCPITDGHKSIITGTLCPPSQCRLCQWTWSPRGAPGEVLPPFSGQAVQRQVLSCSTRDNWGWRAHGWGHPGHPDIFSSIWPLPTSCQQKPPGSCDKANCPWMLPMCPGAGSRLSLAENQPSEGPAGLRTARLLVHL